MQYSFNFHVLHLQNGTERQADIEQPLNAEVAYEHRKRKVGEDPDAESKHPNQCLTKVEVDALLEVTA